MNTQIYTHTCINRVRREEINWSVLKQARFTGICCYSCAAFRVPAASPCQCLSISGSNGIPVAGRALVEINRLEMKVGLFCLVFFSSFSFGFSANLVNVCNDFAQLT